MSEYTTPTTNTVWYDSQSWAGLTTVNHLSSIYTPRNLDIIRMAQGVYDIEKKCINKGLRDHWK